MAWYTNQTFPGAPSPFNQFSSPSSNNQAQSTGSFMAVFVNGESEVNNYPVAPGLTVMLIDFNLKKFWLKSTGMNGVPQPIRAFPFEEEALPVSNQNGNSVSREEFEALNSKLDKLISELGGGK